MPFNIGTGELMIVLLVALIVLGPDKLPGMARNVGKALGEVKRMSSGFESELRDAMKEPVEGVPTKPTVERDGTDPTPD